jgi:hypothetical protein
LVLLIYSRRMFYWQARYEKELAEETERNKDDIAHLEALEKHYVERGKAYEVRDFFLHFGAGV